MGVQQARIAAFHPRGMLLSRAFAAPIQRSVYAGAAASAIGASVVALVLGSVPAVVGVVAGAVAGVALGLAATVVVLGTRTRQALEAFAWLGRREIDRVRRRTGSGVPSNPAAVERWLLDHPASPATSIVRVEMLAMLGRLDEARAELGAMEPPASPLESVERSLTAAYVQFIAIGILDEHDILAQRAAVADDPETSLELRVGLAIARARSRLANGDDDWRAPLADVRRAIGRDASRVLARDIGSRVGITLLALSTAAALLVRAL